MSDPDSFTIQPEEKPDDFQAMLIGAGLVFVISIIPFIGLTFCCCIPQILGSLLAVYWYTNKYKITISPWIFIAAGALALFISLLTISYQSLSTALANPVKSLRQE